MLEPIFYVDGAYVPLSEAKISVCDLGLMRSFAIYEMVRTYNRIPFRLEDHLLRLQSALAFFDIPQNIDEIGSIIDNLIEKNPEKELSFRIFVTAGINEEANFYAKDPVLIIQSIAIEPLPKQYYDDGVYVITTLQKRIFPEYKTTSYLAAALALKEASMKGAKDAIYLSERGEMLELTRSNLFIVKNGALWTAKEGILYGITRKVVIEIAQSLGIEVHEEALLLSDIKNWDEVFHSSSVKELIPIVQIDDILIKDGKVGKITKLLQEAFHKKTYLAAKETATV
ncbi:MAG: hypothetical protein FJZ56_03945 [Chlamydiae bacterium]|nr:hypothetical protein [Chlamydiota bacterium]